MKNESHGPKKRAHDFESVDETPRKRICKCKGTDGCSALAVILLFKTSSNSCAPHKQVPVSRCNFLIHSARYSQIIALKELSETY